MATDTFIDQVQTKLLFLRRLPPYIDPDKDTETYTITKDDENHGIPEFEDWYESRKEEFTASKEMMYESYRRLKELALSR